MYPIVIQARMGSVRCKGKVLRPVAGLPLLGYLLARMAPLAAEYPVVVVTSTEPADDRVAAYCAEVGVDCLRGSEQDVASRFLQVLDHYQADGFVRLSGDSPMLDAAIVREAYRLLAAHPEADLVSNVVTRTFPKGQSVELLRGPAFRRAYARFTEARYFEHVTPYYYEHPDDFQLVGYEASPACGAHSMVIDTEEEFSDFQALVARLPGPIGDYGWRELMAMQLSEARP